MIDEALYAILSGSANSPPTPAAPAIGTWYLNAAAEGVIFPYGVFTRYGNPAINTQDRQTDTRQWRYRFTIYHASALIATQQCNILDAALRSYTDSPAPGIMRFIHIGGGAEYLQKQRYHGFAITFDIMENLAA